MKYPQEKREYTFWDDAEIPIVVGVSAHRKIDERYIESIKEEVKKTLTEIKRLCPHSPVVMLNGLAEGGDQLCADVAADLGIDIYAVIPFDEREYINDRDFSPEAQKKYYDLKERAVKRFLTAPDTEKCSFAPEKRRDYLFRQQSIYVSSKCHVLLALWDEDRERIENGDKMRKKSRFPCGASSAVGFALKHNFRQPYGNEFFSSYDGAVVKIPAPRSGESYVDDNWNIERSYLSPDGECKQGKMPKELKEVLIRTDLFNKDYGKYLDRCKKGAIKKIKKSVKGKKEFDFGAELQRAIEPKDDDFLIGYEEYAKGGAPLKKMHDCYKAASSMSGSYKQRFLSNLKWLSVFGLLLLLGFMLYDQLELLGTVIAFSALLAILLVAYILVKLSENPNVIAKLKLKGGRCDRNTKFIEYRALAETLRVQYYLTVYGIYYDAGNYFTWSHKNEVIWIKKAVTVLFIGAKGRLWENDELKEFYSAGEASRINFGDRQKSVLADRVFSRWVGKNKQDKKKKGNGQIGYHMQTVKDNEAKLKKRKRWTTALLVLTVVAYAALMISEMAIGELLSCELFWIVNLRMIFKIVISVLTAFTFLLSYYYGKLSLERNAADSENMVTLFSIAIDRADSIFKDGLYMTDGEKNAAFESLLKALAREQITENGMWITYNRENGTEIPL